MTEKNKMNDNMGDKNRDHLSKIGSQGNLKDTDSSVRNSGTTGNSGTDRTTVNKGQDRSQDDNRQKDRKAI